MKQDLSNNNLLNDIKVSTIYSGIKQTQNNEDDILLIEFEKNSTIAGVFTQSLTSSASVNQCKKNLASYKEPCVRAILVNSGNANAFTGKKGKETVLKISKYLSIKLNCNINQIYTASTGVIGEQLDSNKIIDNIKLMTPFKSPDWVRAATAIKTDKKAMTPNVLGGGLDLLAAKRGADVLIMLLALLVVLLLLLLLLLWLLLVVILLF